MNSKKMKPTGNSCPMCRKASVLVTNRKLLRGHYNPTSQNRKYPNLQWATLATGQRLKICVNCLKSLHKVGV